MKRACLKIFIGLVLLAIWVVSAFGQGLLPNDTLFIGHATGTPGQHVMVPLYIRANEYYQGWTLPLKFGIGTSPITCDSVSFRGTAMENWAWKSRFVNNCQWDNVQTCGATGVYVWAGDSMLPGYYLALKLFFGISAGAVPQTVSIDTTTCSFAPGGPQNNFIVIVHTQSWRTVVIPGSVTISLIGAEEENNKNTIIGLTVSPSVVKRGYPVRINPGGLNARESAIVVYDASGRIADNPAGRVMTENNGEFLYSTSRLSTGVHFIAVSDGAWTVRTKLIVE